MKNFTISILQTSNPKIIKFEANSFLTKYESFEYSNIDEAKNSPLVQQLFYLPFVKKSMFLETLLLLSVMTS